MAMDADFRDSGEPVERIPRTRAPNLDPLEELKSESGVALTSRRHLSRPSFVHQAAAGTTSGRGYAQVNAPSDALKLL
jgi:hypothetical protein